jgi:HPt (histidine-containing phosphotransfer) domain-containing protein
LAAGVSDADDLAAALAALGAEYRANLAPRLDALEALAAALARGQGDAEDLRTLRRGLHTIAGSAKTFGLPAVTDAARAGEAFLDPWRDTVKPPGAAEWAELDRLLAALRAAAQSA